MRTIILVVLLAACSQSVTGRHVNIPATRHAIQDAIHKDAASHPEAARSVMSMGQVTEARAVVYTQRGNDAATRREEVWVKSGQQWTLDQNGVAGESAPGTTTN